MLYYNSYWNIDPLTFTGYIRKSRKCVKYTSIFIKFQKGFINTRQTPEFEKKGNCVIQKQMSDGQSLRNGFSTLLNIKNFQPTST